MTSKLNNYRLTVIEIERFAVHDGPGIRTVVFLKGCPLRCQWCSNPESQQRLAQLFYREDRCVGCGRCAAACPRGNIRLVDGRLRIDRSACVACGHCEEACPNQALWVVGKTMTAGEVISLVLRDKDYYDSSEGGVTFSGGEAFAQFEGLMALLKLAKEAGLRTAVETCGQVPLEHIREALPLVDLFLFDLKHSDPSRLRQATGADWATVYGNLQLIAESAPDKVVVRVPVIPGFNRDALEEIFRIAVNLGIKRVHLLPYHTLGKDKYKRLGQDYPYPCETMLRKEDLLPEQEMGCRMGLEVVIGG